jgi:uncharacterized protein YfaS (alpha-2-macroglobulin family)
MRRRFVWVGLAVLLLITAGLIAQSFQSTPAANSEAAVATYSHGALRVTIPYRTLQAGTGQLTVEVLDPEDQVLGRSERRVEIGGAQGSWQEEIPLAKAPAIDDLVWQRVRYRFQYNDRKDAALEGTESISQILRMPVIRILGQQSYLTGGLAAVRVIVTDSKNEAIAGPGSLRIDLLAAEKPRALFMGRLNQRGTTEAQFRFPADLTGRYSLRYAVDTPIGSTEFTQQVRLEDKAGILLTTEKPMYQPGQTIHVRALALDRSSHEASARRKLTLELEDARGNKIFRKATETDQFGIASAEFGLAEEVNLGTYHLRAVMDSSTAEKALNVERYVLPKFKVAVEFGGQDNKVKHGYRPGDHVTGTVRANYFFGKPVEGAEITVKASGMDVAQFEAESVQGKTDREGAYRFDLPLPAYFAGRPLSQGTARLLVEATVKDSAGHPETRGEPITVSESPLIITAVPEGGALIPNLENQVFLLTSYADGKPASADVKVHAAGSADQSVTTDAGGVAVIRLRGSTGAETLQIEASDKEGNRASSSVQLAARGGIDQILLRTERAVYRAGERMSLRVFSTKERGAAYLDVVKEGQTVLTRDLDIVNGQAELTLTATPEMAGTLDFSAYQFGRDARPVADHRLVFVQPADELKIEATADAPVYKPGDDARIRFRVTNARGEGVQAALGLQVVDEAVFALAEKQPGFAKVFFYLEQEAMKPRYEIHSIGMLEIVEPVAKAQAEQRDRAARALFAATEMVSTNKFETEFGRSVPQTKFGEYAGRYRTQLIANIGRAYEQSGDDVSKTGGPELRDAWGTRLRIEHPAWDLRRTRYLVRSAGPDKRFDTEDDLTANLEVLDGKLVVMKIPQIARRIGVGDAVFFAGGVQAGGAAPMPRMMAAVASPAPKAMAENLIVTGNLGVARDALAPSAPRVRSYFPEALYINPEIITDQNGNASIAIPLADSITTWRMAMMASTARGALGSGASSIKVFQDFFVDLDLPVTLTQGDRVSIPVAVYNYAAERGNVSLQLKAADWFSLVNDVSGKTLAVDSGRVGGSQFTLEAKRIGKFKLTLAARMNGAANRADIVVREIEVVPDGREQNLVFNGRLETSVQHTLDFPAASIPDASTIFVRLYPGPLSQVIEGMDAILRMPGGCFEQTSSSTYPNILALDYMKRTKKLTPEVHAKAEGYIANGYQRLLTFEVPGGGFSWFGNAPANKILTAYGLMEFYDMSKVHDVDPKVIQRTQQWLAAQQQADGSWKPDTSFINEGATNRFNSDVLRITAYIAWALENSGYQGPAVDKARQFAGNHMGVKLDAYTLAVLANFAADYGKDRDFTRQAIELLLEARTEKDEQAWWSAEETGVFATGASASVETTGLAVQALLKWGGASGTAGKALNYIASKKDASGTWRTTQATIMALRALLLSTEKSAADVRGTVEISLNGKPAETLTLTPDNNDLLHQFVFKSIDAKAASTVEIRFDGKGGLAYQVVGRYFVPWDAKPAVEPLNIGVAYDRTQLAQDDIATATATVRNNLGKAANMVMVDLGIPPGFDLLSEDLQAYQEKSAGQKSGRLEKFNLTATQAILYFDSIAPGDTVTLRFRLRAKYPIRARTFQSRVYEYYDPEVNAVARPVQLEVRKR